MDKAPVLDPKSRLAAKPQGSCCQGQKDCATTEAHKGSKTRVMVKYDVGFGNNLFLRGKGANLSWDKGIALKNHKNDEWIWETDVPFSSCEFKVLVNDRCFEIGDNHTLTSGASIQYTPRF